MVPVSIFFFSRSRNPRAELDSLHIGHGRDGVGGAREEISVFREFEKKVGKENIEKIVATK